MNINSFHQSKIIYIILQLIQKERDLLVTDLVAYAQDPIRYTRRMRMLINLADYEKRILEKIRDFESDEAQDLYIVDQISNEISSIVNRNA